jgi:hypothetical protein
MTPHQRDHAAAVMREMQRFARQLGYPPGDQRTARDAYSWHLTETEMFTLLKHGGTVQLDCSEYVPWIWKCVGAWRWNQPGWTGSDLELWAAMRWQIYTDARQADVAAGVIFGSGSGHHMAVVLEPDPVHGNPLLSSHGHPGLDEIRLHDEAARQAAEGYPGIRLLSVTHL